MSQITLIFIRHGEAASSWVSHEDPDLSTKGQDEAKALLAHKDLQNLEDYEFISSPRKRAIDTSKPLSAKFNKKIFIDKTFNEIPSSDIENSKKQNIELNFVTLKSVFSALLFTLLLCLSNST